MQINGIGKSVKPYTPAFTGSEVNVLFFNDSHGNTSNFGNLLGAVDEFKRENLGKPNFCLSGGDIFINESSSNKKVLQFMNIFLDAVSMGNHDLEGGSAINDMLDKYKSNFKLLSSNLNFTKDKPFKNKIQNSTIIQRNGETIGVIGVSPPDFKEVLFVTDNNNYIEVDNFEKTLKNVQEEVKYLESQGINKVFLLAHTGIEGEHHQYYKELAKLGGIDVILGGHDHMEANEWLKSDRDEPVLIAATGESETNPFGQNLDTFGTLNLDFNVDGTLNEKKCAVNFKKTADAPLKDWHLAIEQSLSEPDVDSNTSVAKLKAPVIGNSRRFGENKTASLVADSNLWFANNYTKGEKADFAFLNPGTIRDDFKNTDVTTEDIQKVSPFLQTLIKTSLTKKQIFEVLNFGAASCKLDHIKPGTMQVSGLCYTVTKDLKVKDVYLTDSQGKKLECLDDAPEDKKYTVVYDDFLMQGADGLSELKKEKNVDDIEFFHITRAKALEEYLKANSNIWDLSFARIVKEGNDNRIFKLVRGTMPTTVSKHVLQNTRV